MSRRGLWTVSDTARRLGVTPADVEAGLAEGHLPWLAVGDRRFVPAAAVLRLVDDALAGWDPSHYRAAKLPPSVGYLADLYELLEATQALLSACAAVLDLPAIAPLPTSPNAASGSSSSSPICTAATTSKTARDASLRDGYGPGNPSPPGP